MKIIAKEEKDNLVKFADLQVKDTFKHYTGIGQYFVVIKISDGENTNKAVDLYSGALLQYDPEALVEKVECTLFVGN